MKEQAEILPHSMEKQMAGVLERKLRTQSDRNITLQKLLVSRREKHS